MPLIEASLIDKSLALSTSPLYVGTVDLFVYLHKLSTAEDEETSQVQSKSTEATRILNGLWTSLSLNVRTHVENKESNNTDMLERIAALLMAFRNPVKIERKKSRVRFSESSESLERSALTQPLSYGKTKSSLLKKTPSMTGSAPKDCMSAAFLHPTSELITLVCETCRIAHHKYHTDKRPDYLVYLSQVFCAFLSDHLLSELFVLSQGPGVALSTSQPRLEFFQLVLLPWLSKSELGSGKNVQSERESLIEMTVTLVRDTPAPENLQMLELITNLDVRLLGLVSRRVLLLTAEDGAVARWYRGPVFGERVVSVARALCEQSLQGAPTEGDEQLTAARWDLLTFALSSMDNLGEWVLMCESVHCTDTNEINLNF